MLKVHIPCKVHVKKYLQVRYGTSHTMSKKSLIGTLLFHILDKKCPKPEKQLNEFNDKYDILIPEYYFKSCGFDIGYKKKHYLAICFEKIFMEDLLLFIDLSKSSAGLNASESIREFFKSYKITENDVNYDSIYRQYQREKKSKKAA